MSALTIILSIWATLAICAFLFIRGATARVKPPVKQAKADGATNAARERSAPFSIAE